MNIIKFYIESFKGLRRDVWLIALVYLINRAGEMVIPFMSIYITQELGWSKTQAGVVLFCFGIGALIGSNVGGYLTDRIGNFKVMALSLFGNAVAFPVIIFIDNYLFMCLWMVIAAIFSASFSPAAFGAVSIYSKPENLTRGFSLLRMAINLGIAIGPAIGGILAQWVSYDWLFIGDGLTCGIAGVMLFLILGHTNEKPKQAENKEDDSNSSPYKDKLIVMFLLFNLINMTAFFQILFSIPVYFREVIMMSEFWIGVFFTANGLLIFIFEMPIIYVIEKRNRFFKPMIAGAVTIGIGFICLSVFDNPWIAIISYSLLIAFGEIINFPLIPSLAMRRTTEYNKGKYMGAVSMMFALAMTFAPAVGLPVVDLIGFEYYWYILGGLSILSGICLSLIRKKFMGIAE